MKKKIKLLIASLLTIILLFYFLRQINLSDLVQLFNTLPAWGIGIAFFFYSLAYIIRALRFYTLLQKKVSFFYLFYTVAIHNFWINLLPLRTGEVSYLFLLRKKQVKVTEGLATLLIARSFDLLLVLLFFLSSALFFDVTNQFMKIFIFAAALASAIIIFFLFFLAFSGTTILSLTEKLTSLLRIHRKKLVRHLLSKLNETVKSFHILKSKNMTGRIFLLSLLLWITLFFMYFTIFQSMNIPLSYTESILAATLIILFTSLPLQGLAGFGTFEAIWFFALFTLGVNKELAITTSFGYHLIILFFVLIWAAYGLVIWWINFSRKNPTSSTV